MKPIRFLLLSAIVLFQIIIMAGCSKNKLKQPLEEISRPLSLPPENWRIGYWFEADYYSNHKRGIYFNSEPIFLYPYFELNPKWEYYIPAYFKYYLVKNTEFRDNEIVIAGANAAVSGGWTDIIYSKGLGLRLLFDMSLDYKRPVSDKLWLLSGLYFGYTTHLNDYSGKLTAGVGYQISKHVYMTVAPSLSYYKYTEYFTNNDSLYTGFNGYVVFPVLLGYNITNKWSVYWRNGLAYYQKNYMFFGSSLGFSFTW